MEPDPPVHEVANMLELEFTGNVVKPSPDRTTKQWREDDDLYTQMASQVLRRVRLLLKR